MSGFAGVDDEQLLARTPSEPDAFDAFYLRYERAVFLYFRRRTASPDVAFDLTAETFVAALDSVPRFRAEKGPAAAWLFGIARHKLLRSIQRGRVEDQARRRLGFSRLAVDDDELERIDRLAHEPAHELLALLPDEQAAAVRARVIDEQPYDVIAARLRCSPLVARKRVSRGLAALRNALGDGR